MSHGVLIIRHSGPGVLCNSNQASQYGHSDVAATATHQSGRGRVVATLGGTKPLGWPRTRPEGTCNVFYNTVRIAMFQPSWLKFTSYWRLHQPPRLGN